MKNIMIANKLEELAHLIELADDYKTNVSNKFKVGSYRKAASAIREYKDPIENVEDEKKLALIKSNGDLSGVGNSIFKKIREFCESGEIAKISKVAEFAPPVTIAQFEKIRGIGPANAKKIWKSYNVNTFEELVIAIDNGKITDLELIEKVRKAQKAKENLSYEEAYSIVQPIIEVLSPVVENISIVGGLRRFKSIVHDADILCVSNDKNIVKEILNNYGEIEEDGDMKIATSVDGFRVEITFCESKEWGSALFHFTGPKQYNIDNRKIAEDKGYILSQNGLADRTSGEIIASETEEEICKKLEIPFLNPELRGLNIVTTLAA
jgi:DNA polymerase (family X)